MLIEVGDEIKKKLIVGTRLSHQQYGFLATTDHRFVYISYSSSAQLSSRHILRINRYPRLHFKLSLRVFSSSFLHEWHGTVCVVRVLCASCVFKMLFMQSQNKKIGISQEFSKRSMSFRSILCGRVYVGVF